MRQRQDTNKICECSTRVAFLVGLFLLIALSELKAQVGPSGITAAIRGKIVSLHGPELIVATPSGDVKVNLSERTVIRGEVPIKFSDIASGLYLGTTATKQSDGSYLASEVHVFSEDQRGTSEGHHPLGSAPQSGATMTNGNVEHVEDMTVQNVKGRLMTVRYKGGEVQVFVPPDIPIVKRVLGDRSSLKLGAAISLRAARGADGSLTATQITVRAPR